ncbi:hypothetical protein SSX86_017625 [Deinandra increscens subsp. villosa]|uniref:HTH myb-type domain-containing protein n=1 Tax=Deinandra increscens subsp. villosa TaxID=3103831 RepID=A0AAP0CZX0_9ASTR
MGVCSKNPREFREKIKKCEEYIGALDEERKKIQVFERELPLCLELVSRAIERCRQQMSECFDGQSDHENTSSECPVLEEFIPMKSSANNDQDLHQPKQQLSGSKDWLASAQLSIQAPDPPIQIQENLSSKKLTMEEQTNGCNTFQKRKSTTTSSNSGGGEDKGRSNCKKERRCWSPELHRRFLHALQQLGGAYVATPKQIRELMKVNGVTNDEIKSHLQKYRLHTRRSNPTLHNDELSHQLVVVGRIWMPPLDYTANATSSPLTNDIKNARTVYAPVASLPPSITAHPYKTNNPNKQ